MNENEGFLLDMRQLLYDRSGIYILGSQLPYFERKISRRMENLEISDISHYKTLLEQDRSGSEIIHLLQQLFVSDSRFFSHRYQLDAMVNFALPEVLNHHREERVRIWYHGLGNGAGLFSLLIRVDQLRQQQHLDFQLEVIATDASPDTLEKTSAARFRWSSVSGLDEDVRAQYFSTQGDTVYQFNFPDDIRIRYQELLPHQNTPWDVPDEPDIIVFQNILMYYENQWRKYLADKLYQKLRPEGYLFVGPTESLYQTTDQFQIIHFTKALGYRKG